MDHFVKLESLPPGLRFPADLADRISFDPGRSRLIHHGFMSKADFDRLYRLHPDWGYRRALEELFRLCTVEDSPSSSHLGHWLAALTGVGVTTAALVFWLVRHGNIG